MKCGRPATRIEDNERMGIECLETRVNNLRDEIYILDLLSGLDVERGHSLELSFQDGSVNAVSEEAAVVRFVRLH